jgi:hypothetical protein
MPNPVFSTAQLLSKEGRRIYLCFFHTRGKKISVCKESSIIEVLWTGVILVYSWHLDFGLDKMTPAIFYGKF